MDDVIKLNVGGTAFVTTRGTLCAERGSMLAQKFDPASPFAPALFDGGVFLDRNPEYFVYVLDYLRNGCRQVRNGVAAEGDYFGLGGLVRGCTADLVLPPAPADGGLFDAPAAKAASAQPQQRRKDEMLDVIMVAIMVLLIGNILYNLVLLLDYSLYNYD
eukprot:CAMPEP_0194304520 /NCGR_PEP_ID=MMETSP0171-20130528/2262_1 /TAXON_ID=218684 /ORGANISM="Corethron pennatum, Strain L29A3" /LENGTH=159 /DNA_ID=CAMNT_0039055839 /DNA_START=145 /DNA_END=624 /DNA_ORIENTATION=+